MATIRSGSVRITTTDVYKGVEVQTSPKYEYEEKPMYNGLILIVGLILAGLAVFAATHADLLKQIIFG
jgi:hypothetical protein